MEHEFTPVIIHITNSSSVATKVSQCLSALRDDSTSDNAFSNHNEKPPPVVSLISATPSAASKVISITEIVKRRLEEAHERLEGESMSANNGALGSRGAVNQNAWWQYTKLTSNTVPWQPRTISGKSKRHAGEKKSSKRKKNLKAGEQASAGRADNEGDGNEALSDGEEFSFLENEAVDLSTPPKVRALPILTVYLSRHPIEHLSKQYVPQRGKPSMKTK